MTHLKKELLKVTTEEKTNEILSIFERHAEKMGVDLKVYSLLYCVTTFGENVINVTLIDSYANTKTLNFGEY